MPLASMLFAFFASIALMAGLLVIRAKNPVHSVLFLILAFVASAGLLLSLGLDFFAMVFLVVYVGAIAVLFLFVVMMLNIKSAEVNDNLLRYLPIGGLIGFLFLLEVLLLLTSDLVPLTTTIAPQLAHTSDLWAFYWTQGLSAWQNGTYSLSSLVFGLGDFARDLQGLGEIQVENPYLPIEYLQWATYVSTMTNIQSIGQILYTYDAYYFIVASLILLVAMIGAIVLTLQKARAGHRQDVFAQNTRDHAKTVRKLRA